jgi:O-antigen ligase
LESFSHDVATTGLGRTRQLDFATIERSVVYVAAFLIPFANLRPPGIFFTASDFLCMVSLFLLIISGRMAQAPLGSITLVWLATFGLLFSALLISSFVNGDVMRGFIVGGQYLFSYVVLFFVLVRQNREEMHKLIMFFLLGILTIDVHGIITFYAVGYTPESIVVTGSLRLSTLLASANLAAVINALAIPLLLYCWAIGRLNGFIGAGLTAIVLLVVILAGSNSGLLAAVCSVGIFGLCILNRSLLIRVAAIGGTAAIAFALAGGADLLPQAFQERVLPALMSGDISEAGTFVSRKELMAEAIELILQKQVLFMGIGADQFRLWSEMKTPVHNLYLLLWTEGGLFALLAWLGFSIIALLVALLSVTDRYIRATIIATVVTFLVVAMANAHMYARYWFAPLVLSLGLATVDRLTPRRMAPYAA